MIVILIIYALQITNRDRAASPEMFRASRTIQMVEEEFGGSDSPVHKSKSGYRASSIAGKHSEDRILKRATKEVHATSLEEKEFFRTVSHLTSFLSHCLSLPASLQYCILLFADFAR